ncbi:hypothetical protein, partial [Sulfuricurvum sp.]|uniref:hypothetical protein n=1 Tax=Sulfuricurvum sp. TaxID=2025608 RepID=UPI002E2F9FC6
MNKINRVELFVKIALFLLLISSIIVFQERQKHQLNEIYHNAQNIKTELENNIQSGIDAVQYLNVSAQMILDNKDRMQLKFAPLVEEYDEKGNYNSDHVFDNNVANEDKVNI